jgi:5-methyltetrahydropteroyltriglutamate--homocysteine methyltransferase
MEIHMMQHGIYPRSRGLARAISRYMSGKLSRESLEEVYTIYTEKFFKQMTRIGCRRFSDGMLRWDDIFNPLISWIEGVEVDGLKRFYDNNYFFRQPVIKSKISYREAIASSLLERSVEIAKKMDVQADRLSLSLPGPFTMVTNSLLNQSEYSIEGFLRDYVEKVLVTEIDRSLRMGVTNIDLHEPSLVVYNISLKEIEDIYRGLSERFPKARLWIITYFGYKKETIYTLAKLAGRSGNIFYTADLTEIASPPWDQISDIASMGGLALSIVNTRTTKIEDQRNLVDKILKAIGRRGRAELYLTHNASLEFLPEVVAVKKLKLLRRIVSSIRKRLG